ncbi:MAG: aspartate kinase [Patescibacteria group bacterium]|nr:aspartate kinase [Patescibacteria group bacterium]
MKTNVAKLGGSSLKSSSVMAQSINYIIEPGDCYHIVVSAPGESDEEGKEHGRITQDLKRVYELMEKGLPWEDEMNEVLKVFSRMAGELNVALETIDDFSSGVIQRIKKNGMYRDYVLRLGEYFNGRLITAYLNKTGRRAKMVDPMECIYFYKDGTVNYEKSYIHIRTLCKGNYIFIIPGFYGQDWDGRVKTFPFNGSDVTGAIVAAALDAKIYDKGTDVGGIYTARPNLENSNPQIIKKMTLSDLRKLTYLGMSAVHEDTLAPLFEKGITMRVRNPNTPENMGTLVVPEISERPKGIIGLAGKNNFIILSIEKRMMNSEVGSALRTLSVLKDLKIPFDHAPTGIDTMCFAIDLQYLSNNFPYHTEIISRVKNAIEADIVKIIDDIAILSVVWTEYDLYFDHQISGALLREGVKALQIDGGAFTGQKLVYLNKADLLRAEEALHKEFFG